MLNAPGRARGWAMGLILAVMGAGGAGAQPYYVDAAAPGGGTGTSWGTAFNDLQAALGVAASGTEIRVAQGRYTPAGMNGNPSAGFVLTDGVRLLGGWAGRASLTPDARDPGVYVTVLSGDLNGNDVALTGANMEENSYNVLKQFTPGVGTVVDGFTISGGNATSSIEGAGMRLFGSSVAVSRCLFVGNHADAAGGAGGAVAAFGGAPTFTDCSFVQNSSRDPNGASGGFGGGMYASNVVLERCTFLGNHAYQGGGVYVAGSMTAVDCVFESNVADIRGGGVNRAGTGALVLTGCTFRSNSSFDGGGLMLFTVDAGVDINGCTFASNWATFGGGINGLTEGMTVRRSLFTGNNAIVAGGAIGASAGASQIINCTIAANTSPKGAGICVIASDGVPVVKNCILWGNTGGLSEEDSQIVVFTPGNPAPTVTYTDVQGLTALTGVGNIGGDPMFVNPVLNDYTLQPGSPCVDAGDPSTPAEDGSREDMGAFSAVNARPVVVFICQQLTAIGSSAQVRVDASGSFDPDDAPGTLLVEWFIDAAPGCTGTLGTCGVQTLSLSFGSHLVTLRITDPHGASSESTKTLNITPAMLSLFEADQVTIDFQRGPASQNRGTIRFAGEVALPYGVNYTEQAAIVGLAMNIAGLPAVPAQVLTMHVSSGDLDHWSFDACNATGITRLDIDWKGGSFKYHPPGRPLELKSELITSNQTVLTMRLKGGHNRPAFGMDIGGLASVAVAANGTVTANVPVEVRDAGKEITLTLPFPIVNTTVVTFSGGVTGTITAGPYLTTSTGRFRLEANFGTSVYPARAGTTPRTVELDVAIGAQGYPGEGNLGPADLTVGGDKWKAH